MKTATNYTEVELKKKTLVVLDAVAEEMGIIYEDVFQVKNPKKSLVVAEILRVQETLNFSEEGKTDTSPSMHRDLNELEQREFRQWARTNYTPGDTINSTWHPVVREECAEINAEAEIEKKGGKPRRGNSGGDVKRQGTGDPKRQGGTEPEEVREKTIKKVSDLVEGEAFCFTTNKKVYAAIRVYEDNKKRKHVVVKTDAPTKSNPETMDLYYVNHLAMDVVMVMAQ